jgi:hypothetical protein
MIAIHLLMIVLVLDVPPAPPPPAPAPRARRADPLSADPLRWRALFADDPPVSTLRAAATALAQAEPDRAQSLVTRARWSALLPELRVRFDRRFARTESLDLGRSAADPFATPVGVDSINDLRYELRATWDLARLAFNPDEVAARTHALRMTDVRRELESAVIRLYFERRRLKAEAAASDSNEVAPVGVRVELRMAEVEAELDALTGGAFTRWRTTHAGETAGAPP